MTRVVACESPEPGSVSIVWSNGERTIYRCDTAAHRVTVTDETGRPCFAFGSRGAHPGQFESPMDVAFVTPEFDGEDLPTHLAAALWLAVADYGNRRVQIFELDGCLVGSVDDIEEAAMGHPCRLRWRAPILDVESDRRRARADPPRRRAAVCVRAARDAARHARAARRLA